MGWGANLLFGTLGAQFRLDEQEHALRLLRGSVQGRGDVDRNQDANIEALWEENHELKIYLRALIHLLVSKRLVSSEEIGQMVRTIERSAEPETRPTPNSPSGAADTSQELQDLRNAVEQRRSDAAGRGIAKT
jgi:hypothetical protein